MKQFNTKQGIKGIRFAYNHQVRTGIEEKDKLIVEHRLKVLDHARLFGIKSAIDAFDVSERTIKYWRHRLKEKRGNPNSLVKASTRPHHLHSPHYDKETYDYVVKFKKERPRIGKEKIAVFLKRDLGKTVSPSTAYRIVLHAKKKGDLPMKVKYTLNGKTGTLHVRKEKKTRKKLRRNGYKPDKAGDLVQVDTIELRIKQLKKFFLSTGVDVFNRKAYARIALHHNSKEAKEFLIHLPQYFSCSILHAQTDNGKEFMKYFDQACEELKINHFWNHPRCPKENSFIERFNRTIQEEWVESNMDLFYFGSLEELQASLDKYLEWYNHERPHWSLDFMTPEEYNEKNKKD